MGDRLNKENILKKDDEAQKNLVSLSDSFDQPILSLV